MTTDPRAAAAAAARTLLDALAALPTPPTLRVVDADGNLACLILVWDARRAMPTAAGERQRRSGGGRVGCRADVLELVRDAGRSLTRKEVVRGLRDAGKGHGPGTVAKARADLTAAGELLNPRDKRGYRLAEWPRRRPTPGLFD